VIKPKKTKLRNRLRREIVHEAIRAQIIKGTLQAGTLLSELQLAASFKASRTPVREALMQLREEGLVEMVPRRGPVVRHLLPAEMTELLMVREALEALAVQLCARRMPQAQLKELQAEWLEIQRNLSEKTQDAVFAKCEEFHQQLVEGAQSAVISKMVGTIRDRIASARQLYLRPHGAHASMDLLKLSCDEHLRIIKAMLARDGKQCDQLIRAHLRGIAREIMHGAGVTLP
jgi:DNA-binding GntR family transcriptional regulator